LPLCALLSKPLLALAFHYERDAAVSLAIGANVLRLVGDDGVLVRDLPRASGVSKEAIAMATNFLCKQGYAVMQTENRARRLTLTANGGRARDAYRDRLARVGEAWRKRFGERAIDRLQDVLEEIAGPPAAPQSRLLRVSNPIPTAGAHPYHRHKRYRTFRWFFIGAAIPTEVSSTSTARRA